MRFGAQEALTVLGLTQGRAVGLIAELGSPHWGWGRVKAMCHLSFLFQTHYPKDFQGDLKGIPAEVAKCSRPLNPSTGPIMPLFWSLPHPSFPTMSQGFLLKLLCYSSEFVSLAGPQLSCRNQKLHIKIRLAFYRKNKIFRKLSKKNKKQFLIHPELSSL